MFPHKSATFLRLKPYEKSVQVLEAVRKLQFQNSSTMKTMTLDEIMRTPLSEADRKIIRSARATPSDDCPEQTNEELRQFRPWYDRESTPVNIRIDNDVLAALKAGGGEYQTRINTILRRAVFG